MIATFLSSNIFGGVFISYYSEEIVPLSWHKLIDLNYYKQFWRLLCYHYTKLVYTNTTIKITAVFVVINERTVYYDTRIIVSTVKLLYHGQGG